MLQSAPTQALGSFAADLYAKRLPEDVEAKLGELFLDYLRVASIGVGMPWSEWARSYCTRVGGRGRSNLLFSRSQTSPPQAAFLNATYAGSIDSDDTHVGSMLHPGAIVFSSALAIASETETSGSQFLSAVAAGYEAMIRIALAIQPAHFQRGFQSTATCGAFGSTTTAAMLLGRGHDTARRVSEAIGIAASFSGGLTQFYFSGSTVKRIHAAHAAESGVAAALLGCEGFSGPTDILEGANGFARAYSDQSNFDYLTDALGTQFRLLEVTTKMHACSARVQSAVEAALEIIAGQGIAVDEVEGLRIGVPSVIVGRLTLPHPKDVQAAQMSMPFSVALALSKASDVGPGFALDVADYEHGLSDPGVRELEDRIRCEIDPEVEAATTVESVPAKVVIRTLSGQEYSAFVRAPKGSPSRPLTHEEHIDRFNHELKKRLSKHSCEAIVRAAENLAALDSMASVVQLISTGE